MKASSDYRRGMKAGVRRTLRAFSIFAKHPYGDAVAALVGDEPHVVAAKLLAAMRKWRRRKP